MKKYKYWKGTKIFWGEDNHKKVEKWLDAQEGWELVYYFENDNRQIRHLNISFIFKREIQ